MAQQPPGYPPSPPGSPPAGYPPPPGGPAPYPGSPQDPYAAERALREWAGSRGWEISDSPDLGWYRSWYPCVYAFPIARVGRELRFAVPDGRGFVVEGFENDPVKEATGENRHLFAFVLANRFTARAALRSKSGAGVVDDICHGLGSLFSGQRSVLADPTFEARFDVSAPSPHEGAAALPISLRQAVYNSPWRGIVEVRPGGMLVVPFGYSAFEPMSLDALVSLVRAFLDAVPTSGR